MEDFMILALFLILSALLALSAEAQQCTQTQLNGEFMTDPTQRGYKACSTNQDLSNAVTTNDQCVLAKFNAPCTDHAACKVDNVMTKEQVMETLVDSTELETLARSTTANDVARKSELDWLLRMTSFNMAKSSWQQKWKNVFAQGAGASPITNANINNAQLKDAPRCEIVCKKGNGCTMSDVSLGLRGTP